MSSMSFSMEQAAPRRLNRRPFWEELIIQAIAVGGLVFSLKIAMKYLDPYKEQREQAKKRSVFLNKMLGRKVDLTEYEQLLAANVINPKYIDVDLSDVSGLDDLIAELELKVLIPMLQPDMYCTTLFKPARGVLLYGPPGTGKTMLAKALAKHSGCYFLNITASSIMSKWLGDANRLVRAIFTLAEKLQPCIIFIDEVDAMLGKRGSQSEHEASLQVKTEFMQLWDGMESTRGQRIVVMGATNRPGMVDEAVLRRFSIQHEVGLPNASQRAAILTSYLKRHANELGPAAVQPQLLNNTPVEGGSELGAVDYLASQTDGFSGSDLMELCSQAAQRVLGEYWVTRSQAAKQSGVLGGKPKRTPGQTKSPVSSRRASLSNSNSKSTNNAESTGSSSGSDVVLRAVTVDDFKAVLNHMMPSTAKADEYTQREAGGAGNMLDLLQAFARMAAAGNNNVKKDENSNGI